jgi:para-nitrobenzyl esterase
MQLPVFGDMDFRSNGMSEDCLFLNVWTPADGAQGLPVLVYFYGGGNIAGDGSEPRYDGAALAAQGIITVTVNYRLGVFGFLAHPEFAAADGSIGNYGYLDQVTALRWIQTNIAAFGGDPARVTIVGESAGSVSVSVLMASPQGKGLFAQAMGSSASVMGTMTAHPRAVAEQYATAFAASIGAPSAAALRALPADELLQRAATCSPEDCNATIDGVFLPKSPFDIYAHGQQGRVPLLVGWNSTEVPHMFLLGDQTPTIAHYEAAVQARFGAHAAAVLAVYDAQTDADVITVATDLGSDMFIGQSTWLWAELQHQTAQQPVYRYLYAHPRPAMRPELGNAVSGLAGGVIHTDEPAPPPPPMAVGAVHSADIEYFMGNLESNAVYAWESTDYAVSTQMQQIYLNFVKTGNPNGPGIPAWEPYGGTGTQPVLTIAATSFCAPEVYRDRHLLLESLRLTP